MWKPCFVSKKNCRQRTKMVEEYALEFQRLIERNNLHETEAQIVGRFLNGLRLEIEDQDGLQLVHTLQNAIRLAKKVEMQLEK